MKYYELILKGFRGNTDATDNLVVWVCVHDRCPLDIEELTQHATSVIREVNYMHGSVEAGIDYEFTENVHDTDILTEFVADLYSRVMQTSGFTGEEFVNALNRPRPALANRLFDELMAHYGCFSDMMAAAKDDWPTMYDLAYLLHAINVGGHVDADYSQIGEILSILDCYEEVSPYLTYSEKSRPPKRTGPDYEALVLKLRPVDSVAMMRIRGGGFARALAEAWMHADLANRMTIETGFADLFAEYHRHAEHAVRAGEYEPHDQ